MLTDAADWPAGVGHIPSVEVASTMQEARDYGPRHPMPTWFTATRQTAAHGRRGRAWVAPEGNFYGTLALPCADLAQASLRSFVAALALYDALRAVMGEGPTLALKWPNDVVLNDGKVAGILLESVTVNGKVWGVAVGIGVNLVVAPAMAQVETRAAYPVSVKGESGVDVTAEAFLARLAPAFAAWDIQLDSYGFAPIRTAWLDRAARLGETIIARLPDRDVTGRFENVDESGYLVLDTAQGLQKIAAADVYFEG